MPAVKGGAHSCRRGYDTRSGASMGLTRGIRPRRRGGLWIAIVAALTSTALVACGGAANRPAGAAPDLSKVTLRVGDQTHAGETLLQAAGQLSGTPYHIDWSEFASGTPLMEALGAGAIDLGGVGDTAPIFSQSAGTRAKIVGTNRG